MIDYEYLKNTDNPKSIFIAEAGINQDGDLDKAKYLATELKNNDGFFYEMCSNSTREMFKKFYTEEAWLENWNLQWK